MTMAEHDPGIPHRAGEPHRQAKSSPASAAVQEPTREGFAGLGSGTANRYNPPEPQAPAQMESDYACSGT